MPPLDDLLGASRTIDVRCHRCGREDAEFEFARAGYPASEGTDLVGRAGVEFVSGEDGRKRFIIYASIAAPDTVPWWGSVLAREHAEFAGRGTLTCESDGVLMHRLAWPEHARWAWTADGIPGWAWTRDHARALLEALASGSVSAGKYDYYVARMAARYPTPALRRAAVGAVRSALESDR